MSYEPTIADVTRWADELDRVHVRIGVHFHRAEPRRRVRAYLQALLSPTERKNGWHVAEYAGEQTPDRMQRLLQSSRWNADGVRDEVRSSVVETLGTDEAVVVLDETGFLKKGTKSAGVQRQYSGTAGRIENCQIGVFLAYATLRGHALIDRELYLPKSWIQAPDRRAEVGIPAEVSFATKPQLAQAMLARVFEADVCPAWVTGDEVYGSDRSLLVWLEAQQQPFVMAVKSTEYVWFAEGWHPRDGIPSGRQRFAREVAATLTEDGWHRHSAGAGAKGERWYDWAEISLARWPDPGWDHRLLVRRSVVDATDVAYYVVFTPTGTPLATLAQVAGTRWTVEECFEAAKGEVGLDHYEVRRYEGWYRHITLSLLALAILVAVRVQTHEDGKGGTLEQAS